MVDSNVQKILLASCDPELVTAIAPVLELAVGSVEVASTAEAALSVMHTRPSPVLALLDERLPGMPVGHLLATMKAEPPGVRFPVLVISEVVTPEWLDRLRERVIDDLLLLPADPAYWRLRVEQALRSSRNERELEALRNLSTADAQLDRLTGILNRESLLDLLFRETDRAQRLKSSLCVLLFDIDDFGHWNSRLGAGHCDELLQQVAQRTAHLLRSYDALGRLGNDEFLVVLPGCDSGNALLLAERLCISVFNKPFRVGRESIRLSACFGIAISMGRSPVVVLREAEQAVTFARHAGPETIHCLANAPPPPSPPVTFLLPTSGDELLAW